MLSLDAVNDQLDYLTSKIDKGIECEFPTLNIYSQGGYMGGTLLVSIPLGTPAFLKAKDGKSWANEVPATVALNEGIAVQFGIFNRDMVLVLDGSVGYIGSGANLELYQQGVNATESNRISKGNVVQLRQFYLSMK